MKENNLIDILISFGAATLFVVFVVSMLGKVFIQLQIDTKFYMILLFTVVFKFLITIYRAQALIAYEE